MRRGTWQRMLWQEEAFGNAIWESMAKESHTSLLYRLYLGMSEFRDPIIVGNEQRTKVITAVARGGEA